MRRVADYPTVRESPSRPAGRSPRIEFPARSDDAGFVGNVPAVNRRSLRRAGSPLTWLALLLAAVAWLAPSAARAQSLTGAAPAAPSASAAPFGLRTEGQYLTAPVLLDGQQIFRLATIPTQSNNQPSVVQRVISAEAVLSQIVATTELHGTTHTAYDAGSLRIDIRHSGNQDILSVADAKHEAALDVLTVTTIDAKYNQTTVDSLATQWQGQLHDALRSALLRREPAVIAARLGLVGQRAAILAGISLAAVLIIVFLRRRIGHNRKRLQALEAAAAAAAVQADVGSTSDEANASKRGVLAKLATSNDPERRIAILSFVVAVLILGLVVTWFASIVWALSLFAQTAGAAAAIGRIGGEIVVTWTIALLLNRIIDFIASEAGGVYRSHGNAEQNARSMLRVPTIVGAISGLKAFVIFFVAILATLGQLGVPVGSVVTFGGIIAVGISLGAQNFLRDFLAGFLVLFEDQYVVGDHITINASAGIVETLSLRMVQLRNIDGSLVTIPHSSVTTVINNSRNWSRISYHVIFDPAVTPEAAVTGLRAAIESFAAEEAYAGSILDAVEWIGVDAFAKDYTVVRASIRTRPLKQFELKRELNAHVRDALLDAGLALGPDVDANRLASG